MLLLLCVTVATVQMLLPLCVTVATVQMPLPLCVTVLPWYKCGGQESQETERGCGGE